MRCVTALLSPSLLRSPDVKQPPFSLFRKLREHSSWLPSCVTRCVDCVDNTVVDAAFLPRLDVHRRALRLQLCPNGVYRNYFLCERSLLFVPEWFAPPRADAWPRGLSQVGWPLEDDEPNPEPPNPEPTAPSIPDALARWLEETAPKYGRTIVFLCGTGNPRHASDFFAAAAASSLEVLAALSASSACFLASAAIALALATSSAAWTFAASDSSRARVASAFACLATASALRASVFAASARILACKQKTAYVSRITHANTFKINSPAWRRRVRRRRRSWRRQPARLTFLSHPYAADACARRRTSPPPWLWSAWRSFQPRRR